MRRCAFLTAENLDGFVTDDELVRQPLLDRGWEMTFVPWSRPGVDWSRFEAVVIRSTWDYHHRLDEFLDVLETIGRSRFDSSTQPNTQPSTRPNTRLANPLEIVRWNVRKTYLRDLEARGVPVVPTVWTGSPDVNGLRGLFSQLEADEIVVKPVVSASALHTFRLAEGLGKSELQEIADLFAGRELMAQPFLPAIVEEGEYSLFYFGGELSHAVLKSPKDQDFRVQEEHGGLIRAVEPPAGLPDLGRCILDSLPVQPLYARVDLVRITADDADRFALMELELVEPALYFRTAPGSASAFASALDAWASAR